MSKRISPEENVVNFFNTADLAKVEVVFNIVKSIVKTRTSKVTPAVKKVTTAKVTKGTPPVVDNLAL
jgi:hypothetical protein